MERESESIQSGSVYIDRPRPGLSLLLAASAVLLLYLGAIGYQIQRGSELFPTPALWAMMVPVAFGYLVIVFLLFNTSYRVGGGKLQASNGFYSGTIQLSEIRHISLTDLISQPIGRGKNTRSQDRGFCNRLTKGVVLRTSNGTVYLSPSDPARFAAMLRDLAPATRIRQDNDGGV